MSTSVSAESELLRVDCGTQYLAIKKYTGFAFSEGRDELTQDKMLVYKEQLTDIVSYKLDHNQHISPELALNAVTEFYHNHPSDLREEMENADLLVFQYGNYSENGQDEKFELRFNRKIIDSRDGQLYEYRLTIYYDTDEVGNILAYNNWSMDCLTIDQFIKLSEQSLGYNLAKMATPIGYKITMEIV